MIEESEGQHNDESERGDSLIEVNGLRKYFPVKSGMFSKVRSYVKAVDGVDFSIRKGEVFGIVGESGCGKTTLGRVLLGLIPITSGSVSYEGADIREIRDRELRRKMQIVFQDPGGSMNPSYQSAPLLGSH